MKEFLEPFDIVSTLFTWAFSHPVYASIYIFAGAAAFLFAMISILQIIWREI
jgi:hypothetical protein